MGLDGELPKHFFIHLSRGRPPQGICHAIVDIMPELRYGYERANTYSPPDYDIWIIQTLIYLVTRYAEFGTEQLYILADVPDASNEARILVSQNRKRDGKISQDLTLNWPKDSAEFDAKISNREFCYGVLIPHIWRLLCTEDVQNQLRECASQMACIHFLGFSQSMDKRSVSSKTTLTTRKWARLDMNNGEGLELLDGGEAPFSLNIQEGDLVAASMLLALHRDDPTATVLLAANDHDWLMYNLLMAWKFDPAGDWSAAWINCTRALGYQNLQLALDRICNQVITLYDVICGNHPEYTEQLRLQILVRAVPLFFILNYAGDSDFTTKVPFCTPMGLWGAIGKMLELQGPTLFVDESGNPNHETLIPLFPMASNRELTDECQVPISNKRGTHLSRDYLRAHLFRTSWVMEYVLKNADPTGPKPALLVAGRQTGYTVNEGNYGYVDFVDASGVGSMRGPK